MPALTNINNTSYADFRLQHKTTTRILCIDDDPDIQTAIELHMKNYQVHLLHAYCGMQGMVNATSEAPDLILMDFAMPNGDGYHLLTYIRANITTASIPVIAITGMCDPSIKRRLLQAGADVFLKKPLRFSDLLHQISRFVDIRVN